MTEHEPGLSPQEEEALREMGNALLADGTGSLSSFIAAVPKLVGDQNIDANLRHYRAELRAWARWQEQEQTR